MTLNTILLFNIVTIFSSWDEQSTYKLTNSTSGDQHSAVAKGDTVSEIDKSIWSIFQDKNNNFWFGSNGQGAYRYDGKTIIRFTTKDGLCDDQIRRIQDDKSGNIYFTTDSGISKYDGRSFATLSITESKSPNNEWKIQPDDLWFQGAQDAGVIYRYDGTALHRLEFPRTRLGDEFTSRYPRSRYPSMTFSPYDVYVIFKDRKGHLWFGTSSLGVCRYDGVSFTWIAEADLAESPVRSIFEDKDGNLWFGNSGQGVYRWDGKRLINVRDERGIGHLKDGRRDAPVSYMAITGDTIGNLWIVTYRAGVWRYDGNTVFHYPVRDGNTNIALFSIYKDKQGDLWLGSPEAGAIKFNGKTFERFRF